MRSTSREKEEVPLSERLSLSPEEVSALTGIGTTRIREAINNGSLVAHNHGTRLIVLPDDVKAWLRALPKAGNNSVREEQADA
jgi:excisionase family DNA binding protein